MLQVNFHTLTFPFPFLHVNTNCLHAISSKSAPSCGKMSFFVIFSRHNTCYVLRVTLLVCFEILHLFSVTKSSLKV